MMDIILLAAGNSRRFQSNKLYAKIDGKMMYQHAFTLALELRQEKIEEVGKIILISQYEEILASGEKHGFQTICNNHSDWGISHSVVLGVQQVGEDRDALFLVCDQPYLTIETLKGFVEGYYTSGKDLGCVCSREENKLELGNPCIFSKQYKNQLLNLSGDKGGKKIIKKHLEKTYLYEINQKKELHDIDYIHDVGL